MTPRDKAMDTIVKLQRVADHPNTGKPEAEAARNRIAALRAKHDIATPKAKQPVQDQFKKVADEAARSAAAAKVMADAMRRVTDQARRDEAARKYRAKMADKDAYGQPKPKFDPWADPRTPQERQRDIDNSWGGGRNARKAEDEAAFKYAEERRAREQPYVPPQPERCTVKESFYDRGGEPRKRNTFPIVCEKCGAKVGTGEATIVVVGGHTKAWCCETKPGPRKKKSWAS